MPSYQPKPIPPHLLRLIGAATHMLNQISSGVLIAVENREYDATSAADALQRALDEVNASHPSQISPFLQYRREILGNNDVAEHLRKLVLHLWNNANELNLGRLIWDADHKHLHIVRELIDAYTRNGELDPHFMALAAEIRDMQAAAQLTQETAA